MKRIVILSALLLAFMYALPFFTAKGGEPGKTPVSSPVTGSESSDQNTGPQEQQTAEYVEQPISINSPSDEKTKVTVLVSGKVQELALNDYLAGVLTAEMPASFPDEALKAQAVAARTYVMYKKRLHELGSPIPESHKGALLCDDYTHCKAYINLEENYKKLWGSKADELKQKIQNAVKVTDGEVVKYQNEPIAAVFHSASNAYTENSKDVWGTDLPYLRSVESPGGKDSPKYFGTVEVPVETFKTTFLKAYPKADLSSPPDQWFKASNRSTAGGIIDVEVGKVRVSGIKIRQMFKLNSTNFKVQIKDNNIIFSTEGYGHGVGLSQYGARELALEGKNYKEILKWYYKGTEVVNVDKK